MEERQDSKQAGIPVNGAGATEGVRRTTGVAPAGGPEQPDPEVLPKAARRRFSAEYKRRILEKADRCVEPGELGALLRREGLYSSHLSNWRRQREDGGLSALAPQKRGRKAQPRNPLTKRVAELERETARLNKKLKKAEAIIEFQKKVAALLEQTENDDNSGSDR